MDLQVSPPKVTTEPHSLAEWTHTLCNEEMPIFSNTALSIHNILSDDRKGAMELASVILQDPNLTVKLLKISIKTEHIIFNVHDPCALIFCDLLFEEVGFPLQRN